jgi:hypothetical protein
MTSIRSNSGAGMVSRLLAATELVQMQCVRFKGIPVQTNNTRDRSTGRSMLGRTVSAGTKKLQALDLLMIQESVVLLRVEHFEERAGRVTIYPLTDLVDFVNEDQWVLDTNALECLDDLPRQGSVVAQTSAQASSSKSFAAYPT